MCRLTRLGGQTVKDLRRLAYLSASHHKSLQVHSQLMAKVKNLRRGQGVKIGHRTFGELIFED